MAGRALTNATYHWLHNRQIEAKSGQESSTAFITTNTSSYVYITGSDIGGSTAVNWANVGSAARHALVRSSSTPRSVNAMAIVNCALTGSVSWTTARDSGNQSDWVLVGNSFLGATTNPISWPFLNSGGYDRMDRFLVLNNVFERVGVNAQPFYAMGENSLQRFSHCVLEGNTFVGERSNTLYNDPPDLTSHNVHVDCRVANNFFDKMATKHDDFYDTETAGSNGGSPNYGYRPWLTDNLWFQDGCNCEGNVHGRRAGNPGYFEPRGLGPGAVFNPTADEGEQGNAWNKFVADASVLGSNAGGGDYRPDTGSPLIGVASTANIDVDHAGVARGSMFAAGALEPLE